MMAPGGLLLWCGFNPWSPWLAWIHWHTRGGGAVPQMLNADALRRRLMRSQLAPVALDYLGTLLAAAKRGRRAHGATTARVHACSRRCAARICSPRASSAPC